MKTDQNSNHKSQTFQIKKTQDSLLEPINIQWIDVSEVHNNISRAQIQLK